LEQQVQDTIIPPGQAVTVTLDAYPEWPIPATVLAIIPTADRNKGTVKVRVRFKNKDERILPQMEATAAFWIQTKSRPTRWRSSFLESQFGIWMGAISCGSSEMDAFSDGQLRWPIVSAIRL
jgi:hypothetical protein